MQGAREEPPIAKFAIGDVVQLHSGGPAMTVVDSEGIGGKTHLGVKVAWFDQNLALQHNLLPQDCLKLVREAPAANTLLGATTKEAAAGEGGYLTAPLEPATLDLPFLLTVLATVSMGGVRQPVRMTVGAHPSALRS